jgi:flagellar biosynthetic protein FliP
VPRYLRVLLLTGGAAIAAALIGLGGPAASASAATPQAVGRTVMVTSPQLAPAATPALAPTPTVDDPSAPAAPSTAATPGDNVTVDINGVNGKPSNSVVLILVVTLLGVAPALLLMMTAFTKIVVVLGLTRNALGLQNTPPNQVIVGLSLFLSLFIMGPVLSQVNDAGVQPYLKGQMTAEQAFDKGVVPLKNFMLDHTRKEELALITKAANKDLPKDRNDVGLTTLIPAFVLSELKAAFLIGFVIFVPFLVIDVVVSAILMSLGMMMLPPVMISLPFKLLLFVLVDGWGLVITALIRSYN